MGYVKDGLKRYRLEIVTAMALFVATNWLRRTAIHYTTNPALLLAAKLLPLLPILLIGWVIWRFYRSSDELQRQTILKTAAATTLLSVIVLIAWSTLQVIGLPPLTGQTAILVICGCGFLCGAVVNFQGYRADWGVKQAFIRLTPVLCLLALCAAFIVAINHFLPMQTMPGLRSIIAVGGMIAALGIYWRLKRRFDS
jgi:hypothetical protein